MVNLIYRWSNRANAIVSALAVSVWLTAGCSGGVTGSNSTPSPNTPTAGMITANSATVNFTQTQVGSTTSQNVTLSASGSSSVTITSAQVSGSGFSLVSPALPSTLSSGQSLVLAIQFAPQTAGQLSGSLVIGSNASNSTLTVALLGSGATAPVAHTATLSWTSGDPTAVTYRVYRSGVSGGPYVPLTASPLTATTYADSTVSGGATYFYVVTELNAAGAESQFSSEVAATIPSP